MPKLMRRMWGVVLVAVMVATLVGCAGGAPKAPTASITVAITSLGSEVWWPQDIAGNKYITSTLSDPLVRLVSPFKLEPAIASGWTVSDDGLTYDFTIRDDVFFHDGTKLTAEDVAFTISPENVAKYVGFSRIKGGNLLSVVAQGNHVIMKVKDPVPMMIDNYIVRISIWPKAYIERVGLEEFQKRPIGAGPFKFVEHVKGQYVKMEAFDKYYGEAPKVKELTWRVVPEPATRINMLKTGEADVIYNEIGANTGELLKAGFRALSYGQPAQSVLIFNNLIQKDNPQSRFSDVRVRQALIHALDRKAMAESLYFGKAEPSALLIVGNGIPAYDKKFTPLAYDVNKAKQLLTAAGYPGGFEVNLYASTAAKDLTVLLNSYWEKVGVKANIQLLDPAALSTQWFERKIKGDDIILSAGLATGVVALVYLDPAAQVAMYASPETERLKNEGLNIIDPDKQIEWLRTTLSPVLYDLLPAPTILEYPEGVLGLGPKVKNWDTFDNHSLGLQWLAPTEQ